MDSENSSRKDGIKIGHLKAGGYFFLKAIAERFTTYLNSCTVPSAWLKSVTVLLKKKGGPKAGEPPFHRAFATSVQIVRKNAFDSNIRSGGKEEKAERL